MDYDKDVELAQRKLRRLFRALRGRPDLVTLAKMVLERDVEDLDGLVAPHDEQETFSISAFATFGAIAYDLFITIYARNLRRRGVVLRYFAANCETGEPAAKDREGRVLVFDDSGRCMEDARRFYRGRVPIAPICIIGEEGWADFRSRYESVEVPEE